MHNLHLNETDLLLSRDLCNKGLSSSRHTISSPVLMELNTPLLLTKFSKWKLNLLLPFTNGTVEKNTL